MINVTNSYLWVQSRGLRKKSVMCSDSDTRKSNLIVYNDKWFVVWWTLSQNLFSNLLSQNVTM